MVVHQKSIHYNKLQLKVMAIGAKERYVVAGRGTGKTQGMLAVHGEDCQRVMPRSCGMLLGSNYRKMLTDLIPPFVSGLEMLGMKRNKDFVVGYSEIPIKEKWLDPYLAPEKSARKFFIHYKKSGSGLRLASQDRRVTMVGTEVDYIMGDEAKLLNHERFQKEILPTNRGREKLWAHLPQHHSILFCTDKLFDRKGGSWIMQKKNLVDQDLIHDILSLQAAIYRIEEEYAGKVIPADVDKQLNVWRYDLREAQKVAVAFIEGDTLENVHALGWGFIMQMKRNLSEQMFNVAIMNQDNVQMEGSFYPNLDYHHHGYDANNYSHIDDVAHDMGALQNPDTRFDEDHNPHAELDIVIDWGGSINSLVVCQCSDIEIKAINSFFVTPPETYKDLAVNFCRYYAHHKRRSINMYYDPSGNNRRADSNETYAEEFARLLREQGWSVTLMSIGETNPHYHSKHLLWQIILKEEDKRFPIFRMNRHNCENVFTSMTTAPMRTGKSGFEKDKSSERRDSGILPQHATHFSDAIDLLVWFKYGERLHRTGLSFGYPGIG